MAWLTVGAIMVTLVALAISAFGMSAIPRIIVIAQAIYWTISYVVRPLFLLAFQPNPPVRDGISDQRLSAGGYEDGVYEVLKPILFGLIVYMVLILLVSRYLSGKRFPLNSPSFVRSQGQTTLFALLIVVGWIFRGMSVVLGGSSLTSTMQLLAIVGCGGLIIYSPKRPRNGERMLLYAAIASEALWTFVSASKTPLIAAIIFVVMRFSIAGWTRKRVAFVLVAALVMIVGFASFQQFKLSQISADSVSDFSKSDYPRWSRPLLPIVQRFDQFSAVTDARLAGESSWLTGPEMITHAFGTFLPQTLSGEKVSAGLLWNTEVRAYSLQDAEYSSVSLAEGFVAEGYVAGGYGGIALEAIWILVGLVLVSMLLAHGGVFSRSLGVLCIGFPILFERGFLGGVETISKGIQVSALIYVVWILFVIKAEKVGPHARTIT
ncbi:hypothetical protein [Arthrobacter burdickii]|uniref:O-antigen polysaccharide polymerase Wzy n=1 Tax=Arthrobacter burdickii TaxID=3035920 RepID=A0ABT8K5Z3_9MICC|nr:hypothetical protein [Arthrobacter burdickii]MDN4612582.1 hypothetical protein [Arthrobacter burdickii]